jgi:Tol biopolymer transport system component
MDAADLLAFKTIPELDISPDGARVAYVVTWIDTEKDEYRSTIHVAPTEGGGAPLEFTRGPTRDSAPRWSPDGTQLAFLSDRAGNERQLFVMSVRGGEPRQLTSFSGHAGAASWSPDAKNVAFIGRVWIEPRPKDAAARQRWDQRPRHVTKAQYKTDGQGYTFDARSHLFVVDVGTGQTKQLTDGDFDDASASWSPDGRQIAFSRTRGGKSDYSARDIWVADVATGAALRITETVGRATSPT